MTTDPKLEKYLFRLDKSLDSITVSEKAEIITEIKSHVLEALSRDRSQSIDSILSSLGEPEQVASKYLLEKGLKPNKAPFHPILKWVIIGILGTLVILTIFASVLLWKLNPVLTMNGKIGYLDLMNGTMKVRFNTQDEHDTSVYFSTPSQNLSNSRSIDTNHYQEINFNFIHGDVTIYNTSTSELKWHCENIRPDDKIDIKDNNNILTFDMNNIADAKCKIQVPIVKKINVIGKSGDIFLENPTTNTNATLINGSIKIRPAEKINYSFQTIAKNGFTDKFISTQSQDAINIIASVDNGKIIKN